VVKCSAAPSLPRGHWRRGRLAACCLLVLAPAGLLACADGPPLDLALRQPAPHPLFRFAEDTFAFPNESRSLNRGKKDLYANYCFVLTRGVVQFFKFARFAPDRPRLSAEAYVALVQQVTARSPWEDPLPAEERVLIPGYQNLHEFSRGEESAVKAGLDSRFWTLVHWTNWRVVFPVAESHQEAVAGEVLADLQARRPVQLLITNFPIWEVNHGVVAYGYQIWGGTIDLAVYDPNQPDRPGVISFRIAQRHFWSTQLFNTIPGPIRAFRMHYSPLL
jgi:hypothetical protein